MRTFKHKKTKWIAETHTCIPRSYRVKAKHNLICMPAELIEDSEDWEEQVEKDYEILEYGTPDGIPIPPKQIVSVKRLSDGEVFSVEDDINPDGTKIKGFEVFDTGIHVDIGLCCVPLSNMRKRKPILTSEDGVDLFEGDKHYWVDDNMNIGEEPTDKGDPVKGYKYFSTREAAEDYRLWNYRGLSLKDLNHGADMFEEDFAELEKIVKSRL